MKLVTNVLLATLTLTTLGFAKDKKSCDATSTGTVVSFHNQQETSGSIYGANGVISGGTSTFDRRVYVVNTGTTTMEITGWEHGRKRSKRPALLIGQTLPFCTDGKFAYVVLDGVEHRYAIFSASETASETK